MPASREITRNGTVSAGPQGGGHDGENSPGERSAGAGEAAARVPLRQLVDDRVLDALLERSRDEAGGCG